MQSNNWPMLSSKENEILVKRGVISMETSLKYFKLLMVKPQTLMRLSVGDNSASFDGKIQ